MNKRSFPRRNLDLEFNLIVAGETVPAVVTDFSLEGIGILIKGRKDLPTHVLDLNIRELNLDAMGKVIWRREGAAGLRIGLARMGLIDGMLGRYRLSDIIVGIRRSKKTGVLYIEKDLWHRKIFFKEGEMVYSASDLEHEQFGIILLSGGKISAQQYQNSLMLANKSGKSQGAVIAEMRYLTPQEYIEAVQQRIEMIIMNLCGIEDAKFIFKEEPLPRDEIALLKLNANDLLYRGTKKNSSPDSLTRKYLHSAGRICPSDEMSQLLDRMLLDEKDRDVLNLVKGSISLKKILVDSPMDENDTLTALRALFNAHLIDIEAEPEKPVEDTESGGEDDPIPEELAERINRLYSDHKSLGYLGILGLQHNPSSTDIKRAYHKMAKEFHPDRYLNIRSSSLREKLNVIFAYISEAYRELSRGGVSQMQQQEPVQPSTQEKQAEPVRDNRKMALMKYKQGRDSLGRHDYENAMTLLGQSVYLDDSVPDYHFYYGLALFQNKRVKDAEESIRRALQFSPNNANYIAELGHIYLGLGFMTRAKNSFEKALRINPSHVRASEGLNHIQNTGRN